MEQNHRRARPGFNVPELSAVNGCPLLRGCGLLRLNRRRSVAGDCRCRWIDCRKIVAQHMSRRQKQAAWRLSQNRSHRFLLRIIVNDVSDPDAFDRFTGFALVAIVARGKVSIDIYQRLIRNVADVEFRAAEMYEASYGDYFGSNLAHKVYHQLYYLAGADYVVDDNAAKPMRVQILPEPVLPIFLLGPEDLIGIKSFSNTESDGDAARGRRYDRAIGKRGKYLVFHSQQAGEGYVEHTGISVIPHCQRHLKVLPRVDSIGKFEMAFAKRAGIFKQVEDGFFGWD